MRFIPIIINTCAVMKPSSVDECPHGGYCVDLSSGKPLPTCGMVLLVLVPYTIYSYV